MMWSVELAVLCDPIISLFLFLHSSVGIPALLDVEDMVRLKKPEPRSVQCYVQMIFSKYRPKDLDMSNLIIAWRSLKYFCLQYAISTVAGLHFGFSLRIIDWGKGISFHADNSRKNWVSRCSKFGYIHKCICLFGDISIKSLLYRFSVRCNTTSQSIQRAGTTAIIYSSTREHSQNATLQSRFSVSLNAMEHFRQGDAWKFTAGFWKSTQSLNIGLEGRGSAVSTKWSTQPRCQRKKRVRYFSVEAWQVGEAR